MNIDKIKNLIRAFYPFAKTNLGFKEPVKIRYITNDIKNSEDPLGKTAYYNPQEKSVTLFILNRHPKDILRSFAHELTHHKQHCNGELNSDNINTEEGYAQNDEHMREMERQAYESALLVRDWTDNLKKENRKALIMIMENEEKPNKQVEKVRKTLRDNEEVNEMFEERRNKLNKKLIDKFIKPVKKEGNTE